MMKATPVFTGVRIVECQDWRVIFEQNGNKKLTSNKKNGNI